MFSRTAFGLAIILATASGALAAAKTHNIAPGHNGYTAGYSNSGTYVGTDPDFHVRFELNRDVGRGQ
jgi:hypothetical protein